MSFHATNYTKPASPIEGTFRAFFDKFAATFAQKYRAHKTISALNALSDSELRDIGLTRGEIVRVASRTHF